MVLEEPFEVGGPGYAHQIPFIFRGPGERGAMGVFRHSRGYTSRPRALHNFQTLLTLHYPQRNKTMLLDNVCVVPRVIAKPI